MIFPRHDEVVLGGVQALVLGGCGEQQRECRLRYFGFIALGSANRLSRVT